MLTKNKKMISILIAAVSIIFNIILFFLLPDNVVTQITYNGQKGTTFPKPVALIALTALTLLIDYRFFKSDKENGELKWFMFSLLFIGINVLTLIINL